MANDTVITVIGNLTADPELRFTQSGVAVASFTIASTRCSVMSPSTRVIRATVTNPFPGPARQPPGRDPSRRPNPITAPPPAWQ